MPPATRTTRRSTRFRRESPPPSNEELSVKNTTLPNGDSILRNASSSGSDGDHADNQERKKGSSSTKNNRSVTFSLGEQQASPPSPSVSDDSTSLKGPANTTAAGLSARARRSKRRQANNETIPTKKGSAMTKNSKKSYESNLKKQYMKGSSSNTGTTMMKKGTNGKDEEVVKVKLITGTLYLYKGLHRRAVFVRRA